MINFVKAISAGLVFRFLGMLLFFPALHCVAESSFSVVESIDQIVLNRKGSTILSYQKSICEPPEGISKLFRRSGFIHPLKTPNGGVVTGIHASTHIHHMGLWHAWVNTRFRNREVDFWNLKKGLGTVRYVETEELFDSMEGGAGFSVRQDHVVLAHEDQEEEVVLEERLLIRMVDLDEVNAFDYEVRQRNVSDATLELPNYRYGGGIAFRAPENWGARSDAYLTSTGLGRTEGHATRANWCSMRGPTETGVATVVIMCHPSNRDAPQRMRIMPEGKVYFNYVPTQETDWSIGSGDEINLRYRVIVFDGFPGVNAIEALWTQYSQGGF